MLHIRQASSQLIGDGVVRAMFAARKSVFVDLLGWNVPVIGGKYEIDQFDDLHATYLILAEETGDHLASARLLPTVRPHILGDLFPGLCEDTPPRSPTICEITRFCLDRRLSARARRAARNTLVVAIAEHALATGIGAYTAVAEMGWVQQILSFGWRCSPLGLPTIINGETLTAFRIDIDTDTPTRLAAAGIVPAAVLAGDRQLLAA